MLMTIDALEGNCNLTDAVAQSSGDETNAVRPVWSKPTLNELDIASVTMAGGPGITDAGVLS